MDSVEVCVLGKVPPPGTGRSGESMGEEDTLGVLAFIREGEVPRCYVPEVKNLLMT